MTGPTEPRSTILTKAEEATIVAVRRHTLLPLDHCLYAPQPSIPHLMRPARHRCPARTTAFPGCLTWRATSRSARSSNATPIGFFDIDIAEVQTAEGERFLSVGIDRTSTFAAPQLVAKADRKTAWEFLQHMLVAMPYHVHTILTDRAVGTPPVRVTMTRGIQVGPSSLETATSSVPGPCALT